MVTSRQALETMPREELVGHAKKAGLARPDVMTRVELVDEILRLEGRVDARARRARGWVGIARDLLASVVEQRLHMPDAAALIRGEGLLEPAIEPRQPVATVTLAEIYAAQGHHNRAVATLDAVLEREPDHEPARALREKLAEPTNGGARSPASTGDARPPASGDAASLTSLGGGRLCVGWRLDPETRDALSRESPEGAAVVRVVAIQASLRGAVRLEQDVPVEGSSGDAMVEGLPATAFVRAALGWKSESGFVPLAVAAPSDPTISRNSS